MEGQPGGRIVDTHQHLWSLDDLSLGWVSSIPVLNKNFTPADYADATAGLGVVATVYAEVEAEAEYKDKEVALVSDLCDTPDIPTAAIIGSANPCAPLPSWVEQNPHVRSVRWGIHFQPAGVCLMTLCGQEPTYGAGAPVLQPRGGPSMATVGLWHSSFSVVL